LPSGLNRDRLRQRAVQGFQILQTCLADLAVDIEHENARPVPGGDADVRVRPLVPPRLDLRLAVGRILVAVRRERVLPRVGAARAVRARTMAVTSFYPVAFNK
jgi:hypothetical protein